MSDFTIDEVISVCIARQITDGEVVAQGIATPLVAAGYLLAKRTHAPNLMFASGRRQAARLRSASGSRSCACPISPFA